MTNNEVLGFTATILFLDKYTNSIEDDIREDEELSSELICFVIHIAIKIIDQPWSHSSKS